MSDANSTRHPGMIDAIERVRGSVAYTMDLNLPGMLHAKLLRSTMPHALVARLDVTRARAVPGVAAVLTGPEIVARGDLFPYFGPVFRDQPILAIEKVRFIGDPVVAVAATDLDAAQEALDLVDVEYEQLPAVFTVDDALADGAPLVHEGPPRTGPTLPDIILHASGGSNVCNHFRLRKGDVEAGFALADHIFEDTFSSPPLQHVSMETHVCVADVRDGHVTVWSSTQMPFMLRGQLAEIFRVPQSHVRVIVHTLGGGYGGKCYPKIEPVTAVLAQLAGRPVRLHLTREEEFVTITKHGVVVSMKTGVRRDGTITARQSVSRYNTGAYADIGPRLIKNGGYGTGGPHHIPNVAIDSYAVYTNLPPAGAFRGFGVGQAAWAYETQIDMIADRLGIDPFEMRMKNLLVDGQTVMTGEPIADAHFRDLLGSAAHWIGWDPSERPRRKGNKVRGKGLSCIIKGTVTPSTSTASAKMNEDGSLDVLTSSVEMGQGVMTLVAIVAAQRLGLPVERVVVSMPDTQVTPYDQQTSSSRSTHSMGTAVEMAVDQIREQLLDLASERLEIATKDLELVNGRVQAKGVPDRGLSFSDIIRTAQRGNLLGAGTFTTKGGLDPETGQGIGSVHWHQAAGAAEVEVDLDTGKVEVLRYHAGVYAGRIINPVQVELQTEGNVAFGMGAALYEEMVFDGGQLQNGNLGDYMIASIADMPAELSVHALEHLEANDVHGIGETSLPAVMPAVGNAVFRATGVRITDLPITSEKVLRGLRAQEHTNAAAAAADRATG